MTLPHFAPLPLEARPLVQERSPARFPWPGEPPDDAFSARPPPGRLRRIAAGCSIPDAIAPAGSAAVVAHGVLAVQILRPDGTRVTLDVAGRGDLSALRSLSAIPAREPCERRIPRSTALALTDSAVVVVTPEFCDGAILGGALSTYLASAASALAGRLARRAERLSMPRIQDRLEAELAEVAVRFGQPLGAAFRVSLPLTQELLGSLIGATRETVCRTEAVIRGRGGLVRRTNAILISRSLVCRWLAA